MKKTMIAITALTLVLALSGCTGSDTQNSDSAAATTAVSAESETGVTAAETVAETVTETAAAETAPAETEAQTAEAAPEETDQVTPVTDEAQLIELTYELLQEYNAIDGIAAFGLNADMNDTYQPENSESLYQRVTDETYQSIDDIKQMLGKTLTGDAKAKIERDIFEGDNPVYLEHDGKLYMLNGGRGSGFDFQKDTIKISNITDNGFTAALNNRQISDVLSNVTVTVKRIDGEYYISSYEEIF